MVTNVTTLMRVCSTFCKRYLTDEYEPYCFWWIQLSTREAKTIKNLNVEFGYSYFDIRINEEWIEFNVDYWSRIMEEQGTKQQPVTIDILFLGVCCVTNLEQF